MQGLPGDLARTEAGDVVVDQAAETYLVRADVGVALVTPNEVLIRYEHDYHVLLSDLSGTVGAADQMAQVMAEDVAKIWATDELVPTGPTLASRR